MGVMDEIRTEPEAGRARASSMLILLVAAVVFVGIPAVLITNPQTVFGVDADAVANSVDSQLPGAMTTFGCRGAGNDAWHCPVGEQRSGISSEITVRFTDERCWRTVEITGHPLAPMHDCLGVKDYVVSNADS